jgi:thiamine biosynthesis lipoprotein
MGTVVSFRVFPGCAGIDSARTAVDEAREVLHEVDATFSTWRPDSPISRLRRGELALSDMAPQVLEVLELCQQAKASSRGWFDPWAMPGGVDPTGLVKGWSLDVALAKLREAGLEAALLNAGGDLAGFGSPGPGDGWRIGIRHPWLRDALACVVQLRSAVATSGPYERGAHLVDPRSGEPAQTVASATVTGPNLAMSDALATALAVGGHDAFDAVATLEGYEAYVIDTDGSERATPGMVFLD